MKLKSSMAALAVAMAFSAPVGATDLLDEKYDPASQYQEQIANPFAGFYVGAQVGGQFTNVDIEDQFDGLGADGLIGGIHGGYNFCAGNFCTGPYVEGGWSSVDSNLAGIELYAQEWYAQGGWLVGYRAWKSSLIYAKAAYEFSSWKVFETVDSDVESYVLGGGIDTLVGEHVSVGVFADYIVPNTIDIGGTDVTDALEQSESLRAGLKITVRQ